MAQWSEQLRHLTVLGREPDDYYLGLGISTNGPPDATPDQLPRPNEGLRLNVAPTMKGGSFDVAAPIIGPTVSEPVDFGGNSRAMTCYTPAGAKDGHSFGDGLDVRNAVMFERDNA